MLVGSEVAGTIVSLPVAEKQRLRKGELVALLRADDLAAQLAEARARVVECEAEIRLAEAERDRAESLYAQKVDTASRRDKAVRDTLDFLRGVEPLGLPRLYVEERQPLLGEAFGVWLSGIK